MSAVLDIQEELKMSLDDLTRGSGRHIQSDRASKRAFHRSALTRGSQGRRLSLVLSQDLSLNYAATAGGLNILRHCPDTAVCNNCGVSGLITAGCPTEPLCRNCSKPGHIASECHNEPVCNMYGKPGHIAKDVQHRK